MEDEPVSNSEVRTIFCSEIIAFSRLLEAGKAQVSACSSAGKFFAPFCATDSNIAEVQSNRAFFLRITASDEKLRFVDFLCAKVVCGYNTYPEERIKKKVFFMARKAIFKTQ